MDARELASGTVWIQAIHAGPSGFVGFLGDSCEKQRHLMDFLCAIRETFQSDEKVQTPNNYLVLTKMFYKFAEVQKAELNCFQNDPTH